jgi:chlorobactene glucosyltransferase
MEILLIITATYILFTLYVLIRNIFEFKSLEKTSTGQKSHSGQPLVSICIPARNEESVIERCISSVMKQDYPNFEILVLDDQSEDNTSLILNQLSEIVNNLQHYKGELKPNDWLGKPWACHQLSRQAKGEILVFIDADVWLEEQSISKAVNKLELSDAITVWPKQHLKTFWEKVVLPIVYFGLYTLLPSKYVEETPNWLPQKLRQKYGHEFAAANGQFIAINRSAYEKIGGHSSVKDKILDDVELAKEIKRQSLKLIMYEGHHSVNCRMYQSNVEIFNGLRKNFFVGFGNNTWLFLAMAVLQLIVYVIPWVIIITGTPLLQWYAGMLILITLLQRWYLDFKYGWNPLFSVLHPVAILWFEILAVRCLWDYYTGTKAKWKGRNV